MPGVGVGGLISNLVNPGLDDQIGAAVTPNPNPLAQQGQPAAATSGSPNMPNAAATKQDPVSANLASLLLKRQRQAELAADFNQNIQGVAAGFGTAQQQASKQAALGGRGGGAGGGIGDVGDIMKIQQAVTDQNEHARFMANAGVFAQTLRDHGINVTDPQATELMNNPKFMDSISTAFGGNVTQTPTVKDFNTARADLTASMKRDNPNMSDADIASAVDKRMPPDLLMSSVGGNPEDAAYYQYAAQERAAGRTPMDPLAWKAQHTTATAETMQKQKEVVATQANFPAAQQTYSEQIQHVKDLLNNPTGYNELLGFKGAITPTTQLTDDGKRAWKDYQTIMAGQFGSAVQDFPGSRISTKELVADAPSKSTMGLMLDPGTFQKNTEDYLQTLLGHNANLYGKAHQLADPNLTDAEYDKYANQIYKAGGDMGPTAVNRAPPTKISSPADALALPVGKAFVLPDGTKGFAVKTPLDIKMLPHGAKFVIPGGPDAGQIDTAP